MSAGLLATNVGTEAAIENDFSGLGFTTVEFLSEGRLETCSSSESNKDQAPMPPMRSVATAQMDFIDLFCVAKALPKIIRQYFYNIQYFHK